MVFVDSVPSIRMVSFGCRCDLAISARARSRNTRILGSRTREAVGKVTDVFGNDGIATVQIEVK
jgi:hypothetical protein